MENVRWVPLKASSSVISTCCSMSAPLRGAVRTRVRPPLAARPKSWSNSPPRSSESNVTPPAPLPAGPVRLGVGLLVAGVAVRVMLAGQLAIGTLDVFFGCAARDAQHRVVIASGVGHRTVPPYPKLCSVHYLS